MNIEKLYSLIAKWEDDWQSLMEATADDPQDYVSCLCRARASELRQRIDELQALLETS